MSDMIQDANAVQDNGISDAANDVAVAVPANFNPLVDRKEVKFSFRENKELGGKRPTIELPLEVPSIEGIAEIFNKGGKGLELLQEAVAAVIIDQARALINDDEKITGSANFPYDKCTWDFIAAMPPKERRGGGIPKEIWDAFIADYIAVMPALTAKTAEQIGNAAKLLQQKFASVKTAKPIISLLKDQLTIYATQGQNAEQFTDCVQFLTEKSDTLLAVDEATLLQNL